MRLKTLNPGLPMRPTSTFLLVLTLALPGLSAHAQAPMTCQMGSGADSAKCDVFHYHMQMYNPSRKTRVELSGVNEFASQAACEAALARAQSENQALVKFMTQNDPREKFQPSLFGSCHCDMTRSPSSPNWLDAERRVAELRMQQEIIGDTRELLLDAGAPANSAIVTSLGLGPTAFDPALWPKVIFTPDPEDMTIEPDPIPEAESMATNAAASTPRGDFGLGLDLALVDVATPQDVMVSAAIAPSFVPGEEGYDEDAPVGSVTSNPADAFVSFESSRVQEILQASADIDDAAVKKQIFESAMQRLQVLSNIKVIVLAAGTSSPLADAFRNLDSDIQRSTLVGRLFGREVESHWIPVDAADVIVEIPSELTADPVAVLRESTGRYDGEQRRQALYYVLGRTANLTPSQELWIADLMSSFL
jgi:hypothetical protein